MNILGVLPARIGSTRLPRKPLANINGKTLIQRTYESCQKSSLITDFVVATDSNEIFDHVSSFGKAIMTSEAHNSGTSRVIEVSEKMSEYEGYLNIQADHPNLMAEHIDSLVIGLLEKKDQVVITTPIIKLVEKEELFNSTVVKVVTNKDGDALYFSRSTIPFVRDLKQEDWFDSHQTFYKHLGLYGFSKKAISEVSKLKQSYLEKAESLEQLSWLYEGFKISCVEVSHDVIAVDTPYDLERVWKLFC